MSEQAQVASRFLPLPASSEEWADWADTLIISRTLGLKHPEVSPGLAVAEVAESIWPINPNGSVHGGLVLAIADQVMGVAAMTVVEPGQYCSTVSLNINYMRPVTMPIRFEATVPRHGRSLAFVEGRATGASGRLLMTANGVWTINRPPPS